ncbi:MAG: endonuclease/exonuclease/phosphatase family protein [Verrucomicrobiales bacterium]|nr:endonuclease/exonuclease/phosphatase family protein [Verrucomicrobiales bacterium]
MKATPNLQIRKPSPLSTLAACLSLLMGLTGPLLPLPAGGIDCNSFKLWTFNLRFDDGWAPCISDCENNWFKSDFTKGRREVAKAYMQAYQPDIFGLQEVRNPLPSLGLRSSQLQDVASWFPDHDSYALDRGDGEHCAIFYRSARFTRLNAGTFWLSCTPDQQSHHPLETGNYRITSWVRLKDNTMGTIFYVFNGHWPLNAEARNYSAAVVRERVHALAQGSPVLLLGDFNCTETEAPFEFLLGTRVNPPRGSCSLSPRVVSPQELPLVNSYRAVIPVSDGEEDTSHGFAGGSGGERIDHVLHSSGDFAPYTAAIRRETYAGGCGADTCYPSDHYAVELDFHSLLPETYVDFRLPDLICELGTEPFPFNTVEEAAQAVKESGKVILRNTSTSQAILLKPTRGPITLTSVGGPSILGK